MSIAAVVSDALKQSGMSQLELANAIGVTQSYISQICSGKNSLRLGSYPKSAAALESLWRNSSKTT